MGQGLIELAEIEGRAVDDDDGRVADGVIAMTEFLRGRQADGVALDDH